MGKVGNWTRKQYEEWLVKNRQEQTEAYVKSLQAVLENEKNNGWALRRELNQLEHGIKHNSLNETEKIKSLRASAQKAHAEITELENYKTTLDDEGRTLLDKALATGLSAAEILAAMTSADQAKRQGQQTQILTEIQTSPKTYEDASKLDKYRNQLDDEGRTLLDKALAAGLTPTQVVGAFTAVDQAARQKEQDRILAEIREGKKEEQEQKQPASHQLPAQIQVNQQKKIWEKYIIDPEK